MLCIESLKRAFYTSGGILAGLALGLIGWRMQLAAANPGTPRVIVTEFLLLTIAAGVALAAFGATLKSNPPADPYAEKPQK